MESVDATFSRLVRAVLDGQASDDQRVDLEQFIVENPNFCEALVEEIFVHSLLQWQCEDVSHDLAACGLPGAEPAVASEFAPTMPMRPTRGRPWMRPAAAVAFVAAGVFAWQSWRARQPDRLAVAQIVQQQGVQWSDQSTALKPGGVVYVGRLKSNAGAFTLKFRSGPVVHVVGPASIDVDSDMLVSLQSGRATADVPDSGIGFTITTPQVNVVDQGTMFGVAVGEDDTTDVIVFEGKVDLHNRADGAATEQRLVQGEAVRIDGAGSVYRLMQVRRDVKGGWWTIEHTDLAENTIVEVRDNLPPSDGSKYYCYQTTFHGLEDDAFAYADHAHQWNGLSSKGLPAFLRGADYVKTFNDYRYLSGLEMFIQLRLPANLYIFFDDRAPTPPWLAAQFEDTGVDIGLDEGYHPLVPDHAVAVGGGNSIDNVFSVWRRRCVDRAPVYLGPVGESWEARAMYGIAATPLE